MPAPTAAPMPAPRPALRPQPDARDALGARSRQTGRLIHHDLPFGGYYLHCYFKYNPGIFHDLATANGYRVIFQEISSGKWRQTPSALREKGFEDSKFRDYEIEIIFQKTADASFRIPVDNISSAVVSEAAWTSGENNLAVSPVLPVDPKTLLARMPFKTVHVAYWARVKDLIFDFGFRR